MGAVRFLAWSEIQRRWRSAVALALLVGAVGAIVLATAAGARRSHTALPRFTAFSRSANVSFLPGGLGYTPTPAEMNAVRHVPGVVAVGEVRFFAVQAQGLSPSDSIAAAVDGVEGNLIERARVITGRAANPSAADELVIDEPLAAQQHLKLGGHIDLVSYTPAQFRAAAAAQNGPPPRPAGPRVRLRIVGIVRRPLDLGDAATQGGIVLLTPAFNRVYRDRIGNFGVALDVRTTHGASDVTAVTAAVRKIFQKVGGASPQANDATQGARDATNVSTLALWILAGVAALAGIVALGIVLSREIAQIGGDQATLRSLGLTRSQRTLTSAPRALLIASGGGLLAVIGAIAMSPLFPIGLARRADPNVGFHIDWVVAGPGLVAVVAVVLAIALAAAYRSTGRSAQGALPDARERPSKIVAGAARAAAPPTVTNGLRMALEPGRGSAAVPVRSAYFGAVFGVLGITAVLVFATSLSQLATTPSRYGWNWDFKAEQTNFSPAAPNACNAGDFGITRVSGVAAVAAVCENGIQVGGQPMTGWGYTAVRGTIPPGIIAGRAPQRADEVALGAQTLSALHARIGGHVKGRGPHGSAEYLVVGQAVFPQLGDPQPLAAGALFTGAGLEPIFDTNASASRFFVGRLAPGANHAAVERSIAALPGLDPPGGHSVPVEIDRIEKVNWLPTSIAFLLGGLALVAVGHALATAVRRRARELALLKTLGFTRRQVHATVAWQATILAIVGLVIGIPAGLIIGRVLWRLVANGLGVSDLTVFPLLALVLVVPCAVALVNLIAFFPARHAGRTRPGVALRSE